jgi:hypothetical protein
MRAKPMFMSPREMDFGESEERTYENVLALFGVPKVVGGGFNVLAVDIYKQVVGQQNFAMGAVVSVILLIPAIFAFAVDRYVTARQVALLSARAVPYTPSPNRLIDALDLKRGLRQAQFLAFRPARRRKLHFTGRRRRALRGGPGQGLIP